jgi:hypothetical protein
MNMVDVAIFLEPGSTAVLSDKWGAFTTSDHSLDSDLRLFGPPIFVRWFDSLLNISKIRGPRALLKDAHSENTTFGGQDGSRWVKYANVIPCHPPKTQDISKWMAVFHGSFLWLCSQPSCRGETRSPHGLETCGDVTGLCVTLGHICLKNGPNVDVRVTSNISF